jgi:hypothetical protein
LEPLPNKGLEEGGIAIFVGGNNLTIAKNDLKGSNVIDCPTMKDCIEGNSSYIVRQ